ncbi:MULTISPECIES: FAD-dependent oxidoreductase [unclassified Bacillus (in: firmicutes)]|uniref:FAD-dependent oxidoreductase n=1 Tax=unclassified Bacillus (in: firmicutes) TaxID=185979 RepID=UPI00112194A3|nr:MULTISPECIES: FAD-dependent oxidoreductase [unclassified Bacillus (in: firmicutes)]
MNQLPNQSSSYWTKFMQNQEELKFNKLQNDLETDVVIVGAGIVGILTAYQLVSKGVKVALVEASEVMNGTTGHTTAKITAQHGLIYDKLINSVGEEKAKLYYQANMDGLEFIHSLYKEEEIDCDYEEQEAILYAETEKFEKKIKSEFEAYQKLGIPGKLVEHLPLPYPIKNAIIMPNQAQFHPVKYLGHILNLIIKKGGQVFEQSPVEAIEDDDKGPVQVKVKNGHTIYCNKVVIASHYPFYDMQGLYFSRLSPKRSYIVAAEIKEDLPDGMYISAEQPTRSIRHTKDGDKTLVLFGGESHKTGQSENPFKHYEALKDFAEKYYTVNDLPYRWSAQDLETLDYVPYIGPYSSMKDHIFVATGFGKWGMSNGAVAALILSDLVRGKENPYFDLFTPTRSETHIQSAGKFIKENINVAKELIKGKLADKDISPDELKPDEGSIVTFNGKRAGAYRDHTGNVCVVDTTCTHMGCEVKWNNGERSWDCPCHGSRFAPNGEVIEGPAVKPLERLN